MRRRRPREERGSPAVSSVLLLLSLVAAVADSADTEVMRSHVLSALGLTVPPSLARPTLPVPDHMWETYSEAMRGEVDEDSVRMFYPKELLETNAGLLLSYNLSISAREVALSAALRLKLRRRRGSAPTHTLRVYLLSRRLKVDRLVATTRISLEEELEWTVLDISDAVLLHQKGASAIMRFLVVLPEDMEVEESVTETVSASPLSASPLSRHTSAALVVRYAAEDEEGRERRSKRAASSKARKQRKQHHRTHGEKGLCQRRAMYVDFEELKWQDWILAPKGYDAFECSGSCPHPLPAALNASNHAIVQSLIHSLNPEIPPPCCVPTEMSSLAILYMDTQNRIVIKNYPDMRVEACGCL